MNSEPIELQAALASFTALWSPRIVTRVNDYDVRVAKVEGDHVWHAHDDTDEFFLVIDGELTIALRNTGPTPPDNGSALRDSDSTPPNTGSAPPDTGSARRDSGSTESGSTPLESGVAGERMVVLTAGSVFVVPRGVEHRPSSPGGASILIFEPSGTVSVGDRHEDVPSHIDATTGHPLPG
ncbi:cupin domain-containing protein [Actinomadura welshii]